MKIKTECKKKEAAKLYGLKKKYSDNGSLAGLIVIAGEICQLQKRRTIARDFVAAFAGRLPVREVAHV